MSAPAQRNFSAGELSPTMYARADMERYATGLRTLRNAVVMRTGGVQSRAGTQYLGTTKSSGAARLIGVTFDTGEEYVLEFGNNYVRFWLAGALVTATVDRVWGSGVSVTAGVVHSHSGTNYVCLVAHTSSVFATELAAGKWYALTGTTYELPTTYTTAELFQLQVSYEYHIITIVHPAHVPATLTRITAVTWDLADVDFALSDDTVTGVAVSGTAGTGWGYTVGTYDTTDGTRGPVGAYVRTNETAASLAAFALALSLGNRTITWTPISGATLYAVYLSQSAAHTPVGYVTAYPSSLVDNGATWAAVAYSLGGPSSSTGFVSFDSASEYPAVVGAYQQRLLLAASTDEPDVVWASRVATPHNFTVADPLVDSDGLSWRQVGKRLNRIRHFAEVAQTLMQFSDAGESIIQGDTDGILRPGEVNPRQFSENGAARNLSPLVVNDSALYVQARGSTVRDVRPIQASGFAGSDLTLQSAHLVDGYTIVDWCYQQTPHSVIWAVRSDGALLSLTYVRELGVLGWALHDTDGDYESVACVPESTRDAVYAVVNRTINGSTVRYVERMADRLIAQPICMDAYTATTYSRPHSTLTLSAGSYSGGTHTFTATGSGGTGSFTSADVGRTGRVSKAGTTYQFTISAYTGATIVTVQFVIADAILANADAFTTGLWWYTSAVGLSHLNAESVSVMLDTTVDASPNNTAYTAVTVASGIANFNQTTAYTTAYVGLPFVTDLQTLDLDNAGTSRKDAAINITRIGLWLEDSKTPFAGKDEPSGSTTTDLVQMPQTDDDGTVITTLLSGYREVNIDGAFTNHGRIFLRQVDPQPLTVLSIIPQGTFGRS